MMKARRSESKASIGVDCGLFNQTLVLKISSFGLELWDEIEAFGVTLPSSENCE